MQNPKLENSLLGKETTYLAKYEPGLLFPIVRADARAIINIDSNALPFQGVDVWTAFEVSWLNPKGKPMVAIAEFSFPCTSPKLIESKSFKLYLNSFNNSVFESLTIVKQTLIQDLSQATGADVAVKLFPLQAEATLKQFAGFCIDDLDISCDAYKPNADYLKVDNHTLEETVYSNLLKSNCPVTGQPDWASVQIKYTGKKINHSGLLKYIVSYRDHDGFHEDCVERIFIDIMRHCAPEKLFVYARYTRRGGLDINPYRANYPVNPALTRLYRQ